MNRAGGEAATITIRGLTDPLTTLNGRNIFTAAGTAFALQDISANLVKQIDVYKTRSADQIETGLAGQIAQQRNLRDGIPPRDRGACRAADRA